MTMGSEHTEVEVHDIETIEYDGSFWKRQPDINGPAPDPTCWTCTIGEVPRHVLPHGSDMPMRRAIARAYEELTGIQPDFIFSGWGCTLTEAQRAVVEDRLPRTAEDVVDV